MPDPPDYQRLTKREILTLPAKYLQPKREADLQRSMTGEIEGLTSKSRISKRIRSITRPELVSGQMAANQVRNLQNTLKRWPIVSPTVWMKSMVNLCWIRKPVKPWKFLPIRVKKMKQITGEMGIIWMYCPIEKNLADLGSKEARIKKMETVGGSQVPNGY